MNRPLLSKRAHSATIGTESNRRKIRKGTQSCRECKRRKVRCTFAVSSSSICDGCQRRRTACVGQEFPDEPVKVNGDAELHDRLNRIESVVSQLTEKVNAIIDGPRNEQILDPSRTEEPPSTSSPIDIDAGQNSDPRHEAFHNSTSRVLLSAWPSQHDLEIILELPAETSGLFHGTICAPFSTVLSQEPPNIREILQLPPAGSNPILLARKLLILATYLQGLSPTCTAILEHSGIDYDAMMASAVETVHGCLICHDSFLASIEGIECAMIEAMYYNNAGNLRSAWQSIHRAIPIAQMMGLDQDTTMKPFEYLEPGTRTRVHPECMWFRLAQMSRYLSMMLGLLQGTPNNIFAEGEKFEACSPTERLQRMDCAAGGLILQRNECALYDDTTTDMIDKLLQQSEACLPPSWWLVPDLETSTGNGTKTLEKVVRVMDQLTHYHLITQLHLPHILSYHTSSRCDYSRTMAVSASREVLMRFTALHGVHSIASFCRGINLLAFISCVTLCIVHNDANRQRRNHLNDGCGFLELLMNQHQRDRRLMELTLEGMESMARVSKDRLAAQLAMILSRLLSMNADSGKYIADVSVKNRERGIVCGGNVSGCGQILQIHIPYIGTIKFEPGHTSSSIPLELPSPVNRLPVASLLASCSPGPPSSLEPLFELPLHGEEEPGPHYASNSMIADHFDHSMINDWLDLSPLSH